MLPIRAVLDPNLTDGAFRVLACLAAHGNWDFLFDHSATALAGESGMSAQMVRRYRKELLNLGYINEQGSFIALADPLWEGFKTDTRGDAITPKGIFATEKPPITEIIEEEEPEVPEIPQPVVSPPISAISDQESAFEEWWLIYPRKEGKGAARKSWAKAIDLIEKTNPDAIRYLRDMTQRYKDHLADKPARDRKFIPHPATWLNQERWTDEILQRQGDDTSRGSLAPTTV